MFILCLISTFTYLIFSFVPFVSIPLTSPRVKQKCTTRIATLNVFNFQRSNQQKPWSESDWLCLSDSPRLQSAPWYDGVCSELWTTKFSASLLYLQSHNKVKFLPPANLYPALHLQRRGGHHLEGKQQQDQVRRQLSHKHVRQDVSSCPQDTADEFHKFASIFNRENNDKMEMGDSIINLLIVKDNFSSPVLIFHQLQQNCILLPLICGFYKVCLV